MALLISALLHVVLVVWWPVSLERPNFATPRLSTLDLTLEVSEKVASELAPMKPEYVASPELEEIEVSAQKKALSEIARDLEEGAGQTGLLVSPPDLRRAIEGLELEEAPGLSENNAVVVDPGLLARLNRSERRSGASFLLQADRERVEYSVGSLVEHIRLGDRCFRVERANPLDVGSYDLWYAEGCGAGY